MKMAMGMEKVKWRRRMIYLEGYGDCGGKKKDKVERERRKIKTKEKLPKY